MRKNLIKANQLIYLIQDNFDNSKKLRDYCTDLQDLIQYMDTQTSYHYKLFLVEIYATKIRDFKTAQKICKSTMKDKKKVSVQIQAVLRLSFINALEHDYNNATKLLQQASNLSQEKPQYQLIFINFCNRLFLYSKQCNLLHGLKFQNEENYDQAMQYFLQQFNKQINNQQIQNKFFAAKNILHLCSTFPNKQFTGVNPKKCENYIQQLYEQQQQRQDEAFMDNLNKNYKDHKRYLNKIVEFYALKTKYMQNVKKSDKLPQVKFEKQLKLKKLLSYMKIVKLLKTQKNLDYDIRNQFQKCIEQLKYNKSPNFNVLTEFTVNQSKICLRAAHLIKQYHWKMFKERVFRRNQNNNGSMMQKNNTKIFSLIQRQQVKQSPFKGTTSKIMEKPKSKIMNNEYQNEQRQNSPEFKNYNGYETNKSNINNPIHQIANSQYPSQVLKNDQSFQGSYMIKINQTSEGYEQRYFYFVPSQVQKGKFKLYYNLKIAKRSKDSDSYYDLKGIKEVMQGKKTKAFKRKQCDKFQQNKCFSIVLPENKTRNFYVQDSRDYKKWIQVLQKYINQKNPNKNVKNQYNVEDKWAEDYNIRRLMEKITYNIRR